MQTALAAERSGPAPDLIWFSERSGEVPWVVVPHSSRGAGEVRSRFVVRTFREAADDETVEGISTVRLDTMEKPVTADLDLRPPDTGEVAVTKAPASPPAAAPVLIASDIDGTLLVTGQPPSSAILGAVSAVREAGHRLVPSTGRSLSGALAAARELGLADGWVIASNGAVTARLTGGTYVLSQVRNVNAETVVQLATNSLPGARIAVEIVGVGYHVNQRFPAHELNGDQVRVTRLSDLWVGPTPRVTVSAPDAQRLVPELRAAGMTAIATRPDWVDVTLGGVSKATAIERLRQDLDIPVERTVAIGDGENDIELLQWAWRGVAMGHASSAVQDAADEVTETIEEMGAVQVLRSLTTAGSTGQERHDVRQSADLCPID